MSRFLGNGRRVCFFGGSFDPPHRGHLAVAREAQKSLHLDQVIFAPVGLQPLKMAQGEPPGASFADRVQMTRLAIGAEVSFSVSLADSPKADGRPNYTIDALTQLRSSLEAEDRLFLLLGADAFRLLPHWRRAAELPTVASLIVVSRPGEDLADPGASLPQGWTLGPLLPQDRGAHSAQHRATSYLLSGASGAQSSLHWLPGLLYEASATQLRVWLHGDSAAADSASPAADLLDPAVLQYIRAHRLYR